MIEIGESLWRRIHEYLLELASCRTRDQLVDHALNSVQRLIPFDAANGLFDPVSTKLVTGTGLTPTAQRAYNEYYSCRQPWMAGGHRKGHPFMPTSDNLGPLDTLRIAWRRYADSEYVSDFAGPNGLGYALADPRCGTPVSLSLHRSQSGPAFSDRECLVLKVIDPHINNLLALFDLGGCSHPDESEIGESLPDLTPREAEIFALLSWGLSASLIASRLCISRRTVEAHVRNIYSKLDVHSKSEALQILNTRRGATDDAPERQFRGPLTNQVSTADVGTR